ncbi:MAG TPA: hypothetical protein VIL72_14415 [Beijerinckiaceae bacterium]|jgi:hypothetical protein
MFKRLVRTTSLSPSELELLSGAFKRIVEASTPSGYKEREEVAFAVLELYARGVKDEANLVQRVLRARQTARSAA